MKFHKITPAGLDEIRAYLEEQTNITLTDSRLQAWASELALAMDEGKFEIEVAARYTNSGRPQHLSVSPAGYELVDEA